VEIKKPAVEYISDEEVKSPYVGFVIVPDSSSSEEEMMEGGRSGSPSPAAFSYWNLQCGCKWIMVVDDNAFNMQVGQELIAAGFQTVPERAFSGEEALSLVQSRLTSATCCKYFRLIIMDINMPGLDGFETSRRIWELLGPASPSSPTKILACTAQNQIRLKEDVLASGMDGYIEKPLQIDRLKQEFDRLLRKKYD
jgi:CheY-like chemotaxis protein